MSVRRLAPKEQQPANFTFSAENLAWAKQQITKYPEGRQASAVIPILWRGRGQEEGGGFGGGGRRGCAAPRISSRCARAASITIPFICPRMAISAGKKSSVSAPA